MVTSKNETQVDALVIGAGLGGIHHLYFLSQFLPNVKLVDKAPDVGGTWYYNRYPGAMSDTESYLYRFAWDKEDLQTYPWPRRYLMQPEILAYLNHIVDKHDLRKHMQFNTAIVSAVFDETAKAWRVQTDSGEVFVARYLITALGLLSTPTMPKIPGMDTYKGRLVHSQAWDESVVVADKRVAVIGCGSTGTQIITAIAPVVKSLVCFQRSPQYSVPTGNRDVTPAERKKINETYDAIWTQTRNSHTAFGFVESERPCMSVSAEERKRIFEELWDHGNGFHFMFGGFGDLTTSRDANEEACKFVSSKIREIVKDPAKAEKLCPNDVYARRPLCDSGYYKVFNQDNVDIVRLHDPSTASSSKTSNGASTPAALVIDGITPTGIHTSDGKVYDVDVIVFATGFHAVEGGYFGLELKGRKGETIQQHWANGAVSYMAAATAGFPNMFMVNGPQGAFCNNPNAVESSGELTIAAIRKAEEVRKSASAKDQANVVIEVKPESEKSWGAQCDKAAEGSLFHESNSWIFGTNVPGRPHTTRFFFSGLKDYRDCVHKEIDSGFPGFYPLK